MSRIRINSAYSAQPSESKPNPFVVRAIEYIKESGIFNNGIHKLRVADQGCGKLRHLRILRESFDAIYLIDTEFQLSRKQKLFGILDTSIPEYVSTLRTGRHQVTVMSNKEFESSRLNLDIVFNICVFDVEVPPVRKALSLAAIRNLRRNGLFILIVPRNDQSILVRCTLKNEYTDGCIFAHHGTHTFYRNYRDTASLIRYLTKQGVTLRADLSVYRQVCLIFSKTR